MARKPLDTRGLQSRDGMWKLMLRLNQFTIRDIAEKAGVSESTVGGYLLALKKAGFVEVETRHNDGRSTRKYFHLVPGKLQLETPRPRRDGTMVEQGLGNEQLWRGMRMLKNFTPTLLAAHANSARIQVKIETVRGYVKHLRKAGYLRITRVSEPGREAEYAMIPTKYTGPLPPQIQRVKQVFDPNIGKVVWPKEKNNG